MEIKKFKLKDIRPYEKNPRHNEKAIDKVVESIKQSGYISPIIIDENNIILAGHTRVLALERLGVKEVECVVKTGLTEQQKKAYRIADNRTNEFAKWDYDLLEEELNDLIDIDLSYLDFDIPDSISDINFDDFFTDAPPKPSPNNEYSSEYSSNYSNQPNNEYHSSSKKYEIVISLDNQAEMEELAEELQERGYQIQMGESE